MRGSTLFLILFACTPCCPCVAQAEGADLEARAEALIERASSLPADDLLADASPELIREVARRLLVRLESVQPEEGEQGKLPAQVRVDVTAAEFNQSLLRTVEGFSADERAPQTLVLGAEAVRKLQVAIAEARGATVHSRPRMLVVDRQVGLVEVGEEVTYVSDYDVQVQGEAAVADPVVATVRPQLRFEVRPILSDDGESLTLDVEVARSELQRPIEELETSIGKGIEVRIQLPEYEVQTVRSSVTVPAANSGFLLVFGGGGAKRMVVLVEPRKVEGE